MKSAWNELNTWRQKGIVNDLEVEFVRFLGTLDQDLPDEVAFAASACIFAQQNGHLCLDLNKPDLREYLFEENETGIKLSSETFSNWLQALKKCDLVSDGSELQPLVLEEGRLYLHRFWKYEEEFCEWIQRKSAVTHSLSDQAAHILKELLPPKADLFEINWQDVAVILSFLKDLVVITGGPGTGKTYTVLSIIAAHARVHAEKAYHIALAAPTGKASQRLLESIENGKENFSDEFKENVELPETALTVHKLLGADYRGSSFKYNEKNPLPYDLVIVDEASMLDINLWVRLTRAIGPKTKLIVLGDKDQLASVEAGSILGDLCQGDNSFSKPLIHAVGKVIGGTIQISEKPSTINDCVVFLKKSYRFGEGSGIQKLSQAINRSDFEAVMAVLESKKYPDVEWLPYSPENITKVKNNYGVSHYEAYRNEDPTLMQVAAGRNKILCAIRKSPAGVEAMNRDIESVIKRKMGKLRSEIWYQGRPIMATRNDSLLKIKNGEIGLYNEADGTITFEGEVQTKISAPRIQHYETAYAITVHKSQGSEFRNVALILPKRMNPILSKEILYTSVTRARRNTLVVANKDILKNTIEKSVQRNSGVRRKIWG